MCQIDALQRLKCERHIIKKALENLPKPLDETYERILITIPKEERLLVHHVLRWIAQHNDLYNSDGIPCGRHPAMIGYSPNRGNFMTDRRISELNTLKMAKLWADSDNVDCRWMMSFRGSDCSASLDNLSIRDSDSSTSRLLAEMCFL